MRTNRLFKVALPLLMVAMSLSPFAQTGPAISSHEVPLASLRELLLSADSIAVGRILSAKNVTVPDALAEHYTKVSVSVEKPFYLKGAYQPHLVYQSQRMAMTFKTGESVLVFLGPMTDGLATPIGLDRGEFHINGDPKSHFSTLEDSKMLWTSADPLWRIAPRDSVSAALDQMLKDFVTDPTERARKVETVVSVGDRSSSPSTVSLHLIIATLRAATTRPTQPSR
jgi:hypothetical protein